MKPHVLLFFFLAVRASLPLHGAPTQQAYAKATHSEFSDQFGTAVAICGDTMVVGAPYESSSSPGINGNQADNSMSEAGAAYVFVRIGGIWEPQAYLKASDVYYGDQFGAAVAISGDTIVIGAPREDSGATGVNGDRFSTAAPVSGAAYVFVRRGGTWTEQAYLKASNTGRGDSFGRAVAIDGDTVAIGAPWEDSNATGIGGDGSDDSLPFAGAVYVFHRIGTTWGQQAYLKASNTGGGDRFGMSVAISGDRVIVSATGESSAATAIGGDEADNSAAASGAAYVFARSRTTWDQEAYLKASNAEAGDVFGTSVAFDGNTAVLGARGESGGATGVGGDPSDNSAVSSGSTYVFVRSGTGWSQQAYIKAPNTDPADFFGSTVALSGNLLLVGAFGEDSSVVGVDGDGTDNSSSIAGAAYAYRRSGSVWSYHSYLKASNTEFLDNFGSAVAVSGDTVVVGSPGEASDADGVGGDQNDEGADNSGAVYVFTGFGGTVAPFPEIAVEQPAGSDLVDGATVSFGSSPVDVAASPKVLVVRNVGTATLASLSANVAGAHAGDFALDASGLGANLIPGASATLSVTFTPGATGARTAVLQITSDDADENPFEIVLGGSGATAAKPEIGVEQPAGSELVDGGSHLAFGSSPIGVAASTKVFTLRNVGTANLSSLSAGITGPHAGDFSLDASGLGANLDPGASATLSVTFTPAAVGARTASLQIANNDADENPFDIPLIGYGVQPQGIVQAAYLKASNTGSSDAFGGSVAVSGDTVVIGAHTEDSAATGVNGDQTDDSVGRSGAAYVFVRTGATWAQQAYLKASNTGAGDGFGRSVAISGDTIVVGAYFEASAATGVNGDQADNSERNSGAAYVFVRNGTTWTQQAYLKAFNTGAGDHFGASVAISGDTIVVGAENEDSAATSVNGDGADDSQRDAGAAYVFVRNGATWIQQAYLKASNAEFLDRFGKSVAISGDSIIVGADREDNDGVTIGIEGAKGAGAAYVFVREGGEWSQQAFLQASNAERGDFFGTSVAISGDTIVAGAWGEASAATGVNGDQNDNSALLSGAAYVFARNGTTWSQQAYLKASNAESPDQLGTAVAISGDTVLVSAWLEASAATGVNGDQSDNSARNSGAAYLFVRNGVIWSQHAYLKASNPEGGIFGDQFSRSLAIAGATIVVGAEGEDSAATGVNSEQENEDAFNSGAAYIFGFGAGPAAGEGIEIVSTSKKVGTLTIDFLGEPGVTEWRFEGSTELVAFPFDETPGTAVTELVPGVYRAQVDVATDGPRYFIRIGRQP